MINVSGDGGSPKMDLGLLSEVQSIKSKPLLYHSFLGNKSMEFSNRINQAPSNFRHKILQNGLKIRGK